MEDTKAKLNNIISNLNENSYQLKLKTWNQRVDKIEDDYEKELDSLKKLNQELQEKLQKLNTNNEALEKKYHTEVQNDKIINLEKEKQLEIDKSKRLFDKLDHIINENNKIKMELTSLEQQKNTNNQTEIEE
ncbi:hypothetical protein BJ944DRAFT_229108 [Cunninghamella echinulata]|nr:hypothetical protein BJ944DRAFT_229108 [Cunninghamella echinulata]